MRLAPYHHIRMAIEMARKAGPFFSFVDFMSCRTVDPLKLNQAKLLSINMLLVSLCILAARQQQ